MAKIRIIFTILLLVGVFSYSSAHADQKSSWEKCSGVFGTNKWLECYDKVTKKKGPTSDIKKRQKIRGSSEIQDVRLLAAAKNLDLKGVKRALNRGANPNAYTKTARPSSALGEAIFSGMLTSKPSIRENRKAAYEIVALLFKEGAKIGPFDRNLLFFPISQGHLKITKLLLKNGASPVNKLEGYTPVELSVKYDQIEISKLLFEQGAPIIKISTMLQIRLLHSAGQASIGGMRAALDSGAKVYRKGPNGSTALLQATRTPLFKIRQVEAIKFLLENGADPNQSGNSKFRDIDGIPIILVIISGRDLVDSSSKRGKLVTQVVRALLKKGAKISIMDKYGKTPLHHAAQVNNLVAAKILVREGARVNAKDNAGRIPFDYAESIEMIRLLKR